MTELHPVVSAAIALSINSEFFILANVTRLLKNWSVSSEKQQRGSYFEFLRG
jgi:hypothetical protein